MLGQPTSAGIATSFLTEGQFLGQSQTLLTAFKTGQPTLGQLSRPDFALTNAEISGEVLPISDQHDHYLPANKKMLPVGQQKLYLP